MTRTAIGSFASATDPLLADLVEQLTDRLAASDESAIETLLAEHPDHFERLQKLLPTLRVLAVVGQESVVGTLRVPSSSDRASTANDGTRSVPTTLGDFRLLREIGRGGMGVVYEAEQISLRRRVALKMLPLAGMLDERALTRFRNEAQAAAGLAHPNIVPIYAVGCERGVHYYAMQYIDGLPLDRVIAGLRDTNPKRERGNRVQGSGFRVQEVVGDRGQETGDKHQPEASARDASVNLKSEICDLKSPADTAVLAALSTERESNPAAYFRRVAELGIQAAEALYHAHELGIIHRDIKPGNLLLDSAGKLWITDFGLARIEGADNLTLTGDLLGTLRYMSPEQASGQKLNIDHRTDIYSLGATLYELLTLHAAVTGEKRQHLLHEIAETEPRPPRALNRQIPADLETILLKSLPKEPAERYASAAELAADLVRFLDQQPIQARPATALQRLQRWSRRNQSLVRSLTAILVVSSLSFGVAAAWVVNERKNTEIERLGRQAEAKVADLGRQVIRSNDYVNRVNLAARAIRDGLFEDARDYLAGSVPKQNEADLRGFEWHFLTQLAGIRSEEIGRHDSESWRVIAAPGGRMYASCASDGARFWDAATGMQLAHLRAHSGDVNGANFSRDGKLVATAGQDCQVRVWSTENWSLVATLAHPGPVVDATFSLDGQRLISVSRQELASASSGEPGNLLHFWDTHTWTRQVAHPFEPGEIEGGDTSDDGRLIASSSAGGPVRLWDGVSGLALRSFPHHYEGLAGVRSLDFAHRHPWIVTTNDAGTSRIWKVSDGSGRNEIPIPYLGSLGANKVLFSPDDRLLVVAGDGHCFVAAVGDVGDGEFLFRIDVPGRCRSIAFADHETLLATSEDGAILRFHLPLSQLPRRLWFDGNSDTRAIQFSPDGRLLVATRERVELHNLNSGGDPLRIWSSAKGITSAVFSPDGSALLIAESASDAPMHNVGQITVLDSATWQPVRSVSPVTPDSIIQFICRGQMFVTQSSKFKPNWFDYPALQPRVAPVPEMGIIAQPHLDWYLGASHQEGITCFDDRGVRWRQTFPGLSDSNAVAISPAGKVIAIGHDNGNITLCDPRDGRIESAFLATDSKIERLAFAPDGRTLIGWTQRRKLKLWHAATGRELIEIPVHGVAEVVEFTFSSDGRVLAISGQTSSNRQQVLLYDTSDK